ncbi:MAG TPA: DUF4293 domain-containing protein [Chitinophagaceae bacterium]|jgi:hypothetical protein
MIQRLQSVWLLIAAVCAFLTFQVSFYSGNKISSNNISHFTELNASSDYLIMAITGVLGVLSLVTIFLYKKRKRQLGFTILAFILSVLNLVIYFAHTNQFANGNILLTSIFAFVIPVFLILAARGIWQDEKLVKSMDRLR